MPIEIIVDPHILISCGSTMSNAGSAFKAQVETLGLLEIMAEDGGRTAAAYVDGEFRRTHADLIGLDPTVVSPGAI
jgi:hypothetical protein